MINLKELIKNPLAKGSFVVLVGSLTAGFLNYCYHLVTARFLVAEQYGLLQSFIALLYFVGVFTAPLGLSIVNLVSSAKENLVWPMAITLEKKFVKLSFAFWFIALAFFPLIKNFLHLKSFSLYFLFSWQIFFSFLAIIYQAVFQARLKFLEFSVLGVAGSLMKIVLAFLFISFGFKVGGALGGLVFSTIGVASLARLWLSKYWQRQAGQERVKVNISRHFWQYSFLSLMTNLALVSIYSSDILLVRYFFPSFKAGIYSATSVLGKIIFFTATSILVVSFPLFTKFKEKNEKLKRYFWLSFLFILIICLLGSFSFKFFPRAVVGLLYGKNYQEAAKILPIFAIFISLFALFYLLLLFLLALEKETAAFVGGFAALMQIFLIIFYHRSLLIVIRNSIFSVFLGVVLGMLFSLREIYEKKK